MNLQRLKTIRFISPLLLALLIGCTSAEKDASGCSDAECYGLCRGEAWVGLDQSYWKFEAFCINVDTCNCFNSCDPERCNDYCVEEMSMTGGSCDWLDCACYGPIRDAGADASDASLDSEPDSGQ